MTQESPEHPHDRPEHETKFVFDNRRIRGVRRWLELRCPPNSHHPVYRVRSIYFDTPDWRSLGEKVNSDFFKSKIRLRWYADVATRKPTGGVRLEVKLKRGGIRDKLRVSVDITAEELSALELADLVRPDVAALLRSHGIVTRSPLFPVFQIDYTRVRLVHPAGGAGLCLDHDVHVPRVNRRLVPRHDPRMLQHGVFEMKGKGTRLTRELGFLTRFGCRKQSFSKYLACFRQLAQGTT